MNWVPIRVSYRDILHFRKRCSKLSFQLAVLFIEFLVENCISDLTLTDVISSLLGLFFVFIISLRVNLDELL